MDHRETAQIQMIWNNHMLVSQWTQPSRIQNIEHNNINRICRSQIRMERFHIRIKCPPRDEGYHSEPQHFGSAFPQGIQPNVQPAVFSNFEPYQLQESEARNLDMLMDIPLQVTVELGRTKRSVKEILELSPGSIIELDKLAGEPVDILVNNRPVARGEVVVIDENFGVRVTDIISKSDRIKKLK